MIMAGMSLSRADFVQFEPVRQHIASIWPTFFRYYHSSFKEYNASKEPEIP